ncbi:MAG: hypothetical protein JJU29_05715 [Verrucomicrobia bacterium]|nr:hypothetical protein [Verrucomicrobiota bacterium]
MKHFVWGVILGCFAICYLTAGENPELPEAWTRYLARRTKTPHSFQVEARLVSFDADEIEGLERAHGGPLPGSAYVELWQKGRGEQITEIRLLCPPGGHTSTESDQRHRYPTAMAFDPDNPDMLMEIEHEERALGFPLSIFAHASTPEHSYLMVIAEYTRRLHPPESPWPQLDRMSPRFGFWELSTSVSIPNGQTMTISVSSARDTNRRKALLLTSTPLDEDSEPILPPSRQKNGFSEMLVCTQTPRALHSLMEKPVIPRDQIPPPIASEEVQAFLSKKHGITFPEGTMVRHLPDHSAIWIRNTPENLRKLKLDSFWRGHDVPTLATQLRVVSVDAARVDALERKSGLPFSTREVLDLWKEGQAKTLWVQRVQSFSSLNAFVDTGEDHLFPKQSEVRKEREDTPLFSDFEPRRTGWVLDVTPRSPWHGRTIDLILQPRWTERKAEEDDDPLRPVFVESEMNSIIHLQTGNHQLLGHTSSPDGKERHYWLLWTDRLPTGQ